MISQEKTQNVCKPFLINCAIKAEKIRFNLASPPRQQFFFIRVDFIF